MTVSDVLEQIILQCKFHQAKSVILFGSRAKGTNMPRSDFDIAVSGVDDIESLREDLNNIPTLYKIDTVNLDTCQNTLLIEDINQYGRKIYEKI
jgi:predicted nucleotidyltransferase